MKLPVFFLSSAIAGLVALLPLSKHFSSNWFGHVGYWANWLVLFGFVNAIATATRLTERSSWLRWRTSLGIALAAVVVVVAAIPPAYRVLADETNLISSSWGMFQFLKFSLPIQGLKIAEQFYLVEDGFPSRPGMFPFLLSLLHGVLGFSATNAFLLNALVFFAFVFATMRVASNWKGSQVGNLTGPFVAFFPLVVLCGTSAGYDLLAALAFVGFLWGAQRFAEHPNATHFEVLAWTVVLSAYVRYEGGIVLLSLAFLSWAKRRELQFRDVSYRVALVPIALIVPVWQRLLATHVANAGDPNEMAFKLEYIPRNLMGSVQFFLNLSPGPSTPTSIIVVVAAAAGLSQAVIRWMRGTRPSKSRQQWLLAIGSAWLLLSLTQWSFYQGNLNNPWIMRVGVLHVPLFGIMGAMAVSQLWTSLKFRSAAALLVVTTILLGLRSAMLNERGRSLTLTREYEAVLDALLPLEGPKSQTLLVASRPGLYLAQGYGAVSFQTFKRDAAEFRRKLKNHMVDSVYVVQSVRPDTGVPHPGEEIPSGLKLEPPKRETFINAGQVVRVSLARFDEPKR